MADALSFALLAVTISVAIYFAIFWIGRARERRTDHQWLEQYSQKAVTPSEDVHEDVTRPEQRYVRAGKWTMGLPRAERLIISALRDQVALDLAQISSNTGFPPSAVSEVVDGLIKQGAIEAFESTTGGTRYRLTNQGVQSSMPSSSSSY